MKTINKRPIYKYLLVLTMASAVGLQAWRTLFNNFAVEVVGLNGFHVGIIQSFREVPGFLAFATLFLLVFIKEHRLSSLSIICMGLGIFLTGVFPSFIGLIVCTIIMSLGFHYYETINQSLILQNFDECDSPLVMGKQRSMMSFVSIVVGSILLVLSFHFSFRNLYMMLGSTVSLIGIWGLFYDPKAKINHQQRKMRFKRKYGLFYLLIFLSGARRQIFMVFSIFLLVKKFHFTVQEITLLFVLNNAINYFAAPFVAKLIKNIGEKKVLSIEYLSLIVIFAGYAFSPYKWLVALLYMFDHITFNGAMAIRTYFQKIASKEDISSSTAVSFTINHIAAVILPIIGGYLWMIDNKIPFLFGIFLSFCSFVASQKIDLSKLNTSN